MATYVCSDIHGQYDTWRKALDKSEINLEDGDELIILGDLIDRGPKSLECIEYALKLVKMYPKQVTYLRGNHEQMFLDFVNVKNPDNYDDYIDMTLSGDTWIGNGGLSTLYSFLKGHIENYKGLYIAHELLNKNFSYLIKEMNKLPYYKIDNNNNFVYVHAGFEPGLLLAEQVLNELIWIRDEFYQSFEAVKGDVLEGKRIVHGHTPVQFFQGYSGKGFYDGGHHIGIDGGAAINKKIIVVKIDDLSFVEEEIRVWKK